MDIEDVDSNVVNDISEEDELLSETVMQRASSSVYLSEEGDDLGLVSVQDNVLWLPVGASDTQVIESLNKAVTGRSITLNHKQWRRHIQFVRLMTEDNKSLREQVQDLNEKLNELREQLEDTPYLQLEDDYKKFLEILGRARVMHIVE